MRTKYILITGVAKQGIGMAIAKVLSEEGYGLYLNGRSELKIDECISEFSTSKSIVRKAICDLRDSSEVSALMKSIGEECGGLFAIIHNAALSIPHIPMDEITDENWLSELGVILNGGFFVCRGGVPMMKKLKEGNIIFISSVAASLGSNARSLHYSVAKAGLQGMTKHLALELARYNIRVNAIAPSLVDTARTRLNGRHNDETLESYGNKNVPLGRVAKPHDIADLVRFLVSEKASYITGQVINVDGGSLLAKPDMKPGVNK